MYSLQTESYFDSAHFLQGYTGKCSNIHGHRWRVLASINSDRLETCGDERGMIVDFVTFKSDLKAETEHLDHALLIEQGSLKDNTMRALEEEAFKLVTLDFRPTAENLAKYFWDQLKEKGYLLRCIKVYETPENCAIYAQELNEG